MQAVTELSAEERWYEFLQLEKVAELHQERWAGYLDGGLNRWGIMTTNGSESLNNVFRIFRQLPICALIENTWYKCVDWFYERSSKSAAWQAKGLRHTEKVTELIKKRGNKGRTYQVIPVDQGFHNFEVINRNALIREVYNLSIFVF